MVYVKGEEMTAYVMELIWINGSNRGWTRSGGDDDLRAKNRDDTEDQVLRDVIAAGKRIKAIFKEPTVTPTADQVKRLGLRKSWGSPSRRSTDGDGITISRDTIHIEGVELGYEKPVFLNDTRWAENTRLGTRTSVKEN